MITVATLVYKNTNWTKFLYKSLQEAETMLKWDFMVLSNDGTEQVEKDPIVTDIFRNEDPNEYYINRVYKAWNECVRRAKSKYVVLINSDMAVSDYWLDELYLLKRFMPKSLPCSLLVESGRIPSAMPEFVKNFGLTPKDFDSVAWKSHAESLKSKERNVKVQTGRLFMPVLVDRQEFLDLGGYPHGNIGGISGDKILFDKYKAAGFQHLTCMDSVVYHVQEGEMRDD
jgi:hypothetical protein